MMHRYNIALLPQHKTQVFIDLAQTLTTESHSYLLGEQSLPHVTLCQFNATPEELPALWQAIQASYPSFAIQLTFEEISLFYGAKVNWISLTPDQRSELLILHRAMLKKVTQPIGRIRSSFDSHLTLSNISKAHPLPMLATPIKSHLPLSDTFILSLGLSDEEGQYIERIDTNF